MYQGACTVHCRLNRNSQSRQFIHQQWLTEQLSILMKVSSCHICVSINNKDHDLGNARFLVPNRCVQLPEAISSQCCPLRFAPWWFLKVSPQLLHSSSYAGVTTLYGFQPSRWFSSIPSFSCCSVFSTLLFPLSGYLPQRLQSIFSLVVLWFSYPLASILIFF